MKQPHVEVERIIERMLEIGKQSNVAIGIHAMSPTSCKGGSRKASE